MLAVRSKLENYAPELPGGSLDEIKRKAAAALAARALKRRRRIAACAVAASLAAVLAVGSLIQAPSRRSGAQVAATEPLTAPQAGASAQSADAAAAAGALPAENDLRCAGIPAQQAGASAAAGAPGKGYSAAASDLRGSLAEALPSQMVDAAPAAGQPAADQSAADQPAADQPAAGSNAAQQTASSLQQPAAGNPQSGAESAPKASGSCNSGDSQAGGERPAQSRDLRQSDFPFGGDAANGRSRRTSRFSVGASSLLAAGGYKSSANGRRAMMSTDGEGNTYYSFGTPNISYRYSAPVSAGISLRYDIDGRLYAETGLRFTYLNTSVEPGGARQQLLYAGIPLGIGFRAATVGSWDFYALAYGMPSKCVWGREGHGFPSNITDLEDIPLMWSAGIAPGVQFSIAKGVTLYGEPTLSWYFKNERAPQNLYSENPLYFTLNVGLRFALE